MFKPDINAAFKRKQQKYGLTRALNIKSLAKVKQVENKAENKQATQDCFTTDKTLDSKDDGNVVKTI